MIEASKYVSEFEKLTSQVDEYDFDSANETIG
jgi:hypothetical protein